MMEKNYHSKNYTQNAFDNARKSRKKENTTEAEKLLWYYIKNRQVGGCRFRRQVAIGSYVVDFLCPKKKLIIELDGGQHSEDRNVVYDNERTEYLNGLEYRVVRFWNGDVFGNMKGVLDTIYEELKSLPSLRGDVQRTEGSLKITSTPPPLRGTSPQSREGFFSEAKH